MILMETLKYPVATEKAIRAIEADNAITFIVDRRASKITIRKEFETRFKTKVLEINTMINRKGQKKAFIRLNKASPAIDIATQLGMM